MNEFWKMLQPADLFDFEDFYSRIAAEVPEGGRVLEAGVAQGRSLLFLAAALEGRNCEIYGVDSMAYGGSAQKAEILDNVAQSGLRGIKIIEGTSLDAACRFPDDHFDFVFIDTSHEFEQTKAEIAVWLEKVKSGGVLAGHDFTTPAVSRAVNLRIQTDELNIEQTRNGIGVWWVRKGSKRLPVKPIESITRRYMIGDLLASRDLLGEAAEIGVADGSFSSEILAFGVKRLYLVDQWMHTERPGDSGNPQQWHDDNLRRCMAKVRPHLDRVTFLRGESLLMAPLILDDSLDFVYLDACHDYEWVFADLIAWTQKLRMGGIMAGHDFLNPAYGVKRAVEEFVAGRWPVRTIPENNDNDASFWFVKE